MTLQGAFATWRQSAAIFLLLFSLISIIVINVGGTGETGHYTSRFQQDNVSQTIINGGGPILTYSFNPLNSSAGTYRFHQYLNGLCTISTSDTNVDPVVCYKPLSHNFHPSALLDLDKAVFDKARKMLLAAAMHNMAPFVLYILSAICITVALVYTICAAECYSWVIATSARTITLSAIGMGICCDFVASIYLTYTALSTQGALMALRSRNGSDLVQKVDLGPTFFFLTWAGVVTVFAALVLTLTDRGFGTNLEGSIDEEAIVGQGIDVEMIEKKIVKNGDEEAPPQYCRDDGLPHYM